MCMDVLMPHGWTPATTVSSLMRTIRSRFEDTIALSHDWKNARARSWRVRTRLARPSSGCTAHSTGRRPRPKIGPGRRQPSVRVFGSV